MNKPIFAQRLSELRNNKGFTQQTASDGIGISRARLNNYEQGIREPDIDTLRSIADYYQVSADYLLGITDSPNENVPSVARKFYYFDKGNRQAVWEQMLNVFNDLDLSPEEKDQLINVPVEKQAAVIAKSGIDIIFTEDGKGFYFRMDSDEKESDSKKCSNLFSAGDMYRVPVIGKIPAGMPCMAFESTGLYEDIPRSWLNGDPTEYFILHVEGDSMEGSRIFDGDYALIHKQPFFENGQICAVGIINDPTEHYATLKYVHEIDNDYIELIPDNPRYSRVKIEKENICIYGILKKIVRSY